MNGKSDSEHRAPHRRVRPVRYLLWLWMTWFLAPPIVGLSMAIAAVLEEVLDGPGEATFTMLNECIPAIMPIWLTGLIVIALLHRLTRKIRNELRPKPASGAAR